MAEITLDILRICNYASVMIERRAAVPVELRQQVLSMLSSGKATLPEMANLLGFSTHMLWNWCRLEGLDWREARRSCLAREWKNAQGKKPRRKPSKTQMHKEADVAKVVWDADQKRVAAAAGRYPGK